MSRGFSHLTNDEYLILSAFPEDGELGFPVDCGYSYEETVRLLESLRRKDVIAGKAPYKLTKKGVRELKQWKQSNS